MVLGPKQLKRLQRARESFDAPVVIISEEEAIMNEKYKALFLNMQSWSDWRRTGYPSFVDSNNNSTECEGTSEGLGVPRRLLYPEKEKSSNPNCPRNDDIYDRLENDPS